MGATKHDDVRKSNNLGGNQISQPGRDGPIHEYILALVSLLMYRTYFGVFRPKRFPRPCTLERNL